MFFGAVVGALAVAVQLAFMPGRDAYGICTVCHTRDLMAYALTALTPFDPGGAFSHFAWPAFTTAGLVLGSLCASLRHREFRLVNTGRGFRMFMLGILVAVAGLAVMSCPTRLFLRFAYADTFSLFALAGLFAGIAAATLILKRRR